MSQKIVLLRYKPIKSTFFPLNNFSVTNSTKITFVNLLIGTPPAYSVIILFLLTKNATFHPNLGTNVKLHNEPATCKSRGWPGT